MLMGSRRRWTVRPDCSLSGAQAESMTSLVAHTRDEIQSLGSSGWVGWFLMALFWDVFEGNLMGAGKPGLRWLSEVLWLEEAMHFQIG